MSSPPTLLNEEVTIVLRDGNKALFTHVINTKVLRAVLFYDLVQPHGEFVLTAMVNLNGTVVLFDDTDGRGDERITMFKLASSYSRSLPVSWKYESEIKF